MVESSPPIPSLPEEQRSFQQQESVRRRSLPVAAGGVACGIVGILLALNTPVGPDVPPSFLAMNMAFCAMLIGAGIFFYAKSTPGTAVALLLSVASLLSGMVGIAVYTRQAVLSRTVRESLELANVKGVADAAAEYAKGHGGQYPADILVLVEGSLLNTEALRSPLGKSNLSDYEAVQKKAGATREEILQALETDSDYLYLGADLHVPLADSGKEIIVAVSNTAVMRVSLAVAFGDGSSRFVNQDEVNDVMAACNAARKKMGLGVLKPPEIIQKEMDDLAAEKAAK